jgi:hypothetical protein
MPHPLIFEPTRFIIEISFTLITTILCFMIFFKTKESYNLTKHEGIKYFREAFLLFGISYIFRFLLGLIMIFNIAFNFIIPKDMFAPIFIMGMGYISTIGLWYLIFSSIWKNFSKKSLMITGHLTAILLSLVSFSLHSHLIILYAQFVLLIIGIVLIFKNTTKTKKITQTKILYILTSFLWLINLFIIDKKGPPNVFGMWGFWIETFFQILSIGVLFTIYNKIANWLK